MNDPSQRIFHPNHGANSLFGPTYNSDPMAIEHPLPEPELFIQLERIREVPLWGTNLAADMINNFNISAHVDTTYLPAFRKISVHVQSVDGTLHYSSPVEDIAPPLNYVKIIPREELLRFVGKEVDFSYSIGIGDEAAVRSKKRRVHVRLPLISKFPTIEGVVDNTLIAADYPDGLDVTLQPVGNIQTYQDINCFWHVMIREEDKYISIYRWQTFVRSHEKGYHFRIPAEAYTGYPPDAIHGCGVSTNMFPWGFSNFGWGFGGNDRIKVI
ncbi:hypothetical protein ACQKP7_30940 [Pseudomonas frederiksbergensis]|uniref:hypothetical protein n=1 Tax=Pseudomonas frederiksbergensis TaxID=104087 RepID=UPI003D082187